MKHVIALFAAAAALVIATPAFGAPVSADPPAEANALIISPLTLTKLEDLSFGTIIPSALSGVVTVPPDGSAPFASGGVTLLPSDPGLRARFVGAGTANQTVLINVVSRLFSRP